MPQTPVNLDSAIQTLREDLPGAGTTERARIALRRPTHAVTLAPRLAGAAAVLGIVALLWPKEVSASWQQAIENTRSAPAVHRVERDESGKITYELWQQGSKKACYLRDIKGGVLWESRTDGRRAFNFFDFWRRGKNPPNAFPAATVTDVAGETSPAFLGEETLVEQLLSRKHVSVASQKRISTPEGDRIRYQVEMRFKPGKSMTIYRMTVDAEPETGRIRRVVSGNNVTDIDYPSSIPARIFEPKAQMLRRNVVTIDLDAERKAVEERLNTPLARKDGVTLRLATVDRWGTLWVFWTGHLPDGKLTKPFRAPGVKCGPAYGLKAFTSSYALAKDTKPSPVFGERVGGMARLPQVRVGDRLDIEVPTAKGYALFRNVPLMRVYGTGGFHYLLGVGKSPVKAGVLEPTAYRVSKPAGKALNPKSRR